MGGFRGIGDDALKVKADRRDAAIKMAQIEASERASQRGASVQMASLGENARQADMANDRAGAQLASADEARDTETALKLADLGQRERASQGELALKREGLAVESKATDASIKAREADTAMRDRQLTLNEAAYSRAESEAQAQRGIMEEQKSVSVAAQLAALRAASVSSGPLEMPFINAINDANGVAYGDAGSITQIVPIIDPATKARHGVGVQKIGKDGKPIYSVLDPANFMPKLRASMPPEKWEEYYGKLTSGQQASGHDRTTVAGMQEHAKFQKERFEALDKERTRLTEYMRDPATLRDDAEIARGKIANITAQIEGQLGLAKPQEAAPAKPFGEAPGTAQPSTSKPTGVTRLANGDIRATAKGGYLDAKGGPVKVPETPTEPAAPVSEAPAVKSAKAAGAGSTKATAVFIPETGKIRVTYANGEINDKPNNAATADMLKRAGIVVEGQEEKRYTPEQSQSLAPGTIYTGTDGRKYKR